MRSRHSMNTWQSLFFIPSTLPLLTSEHLAMLEEYLSGILRSFSHWHTCFIYSSASVYFAFGLNFFPLGCDFSSNSFRLQYKLKSIRAYSLSFVFPVKFITVLKMLSKNFFQYAWHQDYVLIYCLSSMEDPKRCFFLSNYATPCNHAFFAHHFQLL